jgi:hypothetical protein
MKEPVVARETQSAKWRELYEAALLEVNPVDLPKRIELACEAMRQRSDELTYAAGPDGLQELRTIDDALQNLRSVQRVELRSSMDAECRHSGQSNTQ